MSVMTRPLPLDVATAAPAVHAAPAAAPGPQKVSAQALMKDAGLDADVATRLLGPDNMLRLQTSLDELSHTDQRTLEVLASTWKVPGEVNWRDVLGDIRSLDANAQGRALANLAMRIDRLPSAHEKLSLMDGIRDALEELRGQTAIDGLWGFARGVGLAYRSDPTFESYVDSLKDR